MPGTERIREMVRVLETAEGPLRDRVYLAALAWWSALRFREHWPADLCGKADCILERLGRQEPALATIASMSGDDLRQVAADLIAFAEDAGVRPEQEHHNRLTPSRFFGWAW